MKAILLNGPPRAGKDFLGRRIWQALPTTTALDKFAQPIVDYMFHIHGVRMEQVEKDMPMLKLGGKTPREVAIAYSELMCKPLFGRGYFGHCALQRMSRIGQMLGGGTTVVFTDSGFFDEAKLLIDSPLVTDIMVIRVNRPGCSFANDSRSFWEIPPVPKVVERFFHNTEVGPQTIDTVLVPEVMAWVAS